jgi:hypothetical protein
MPEGQEPIIEIEVPPEIMEEIEADIFQGLGEILDDGGIHCWIPPRADERRQQDAKGKQGHREKKTD